MPIIFHQILPVLNGKKTQTRRLPRLEEQLRFQYRGDPEKKSTWTVANLLADLEHDEVADDHAQFMREWEIEAVLTPKGAVKWRLGQEHAILPGRGKPAIWLSPRGQVVGDWRAEYGHLEDRRAFASVENAWTLSCEDLLREVGYRQPKVSILRIRLERLQQITTEDAVAEAVDPESDVSIWVHGDPRSGAVRSYAGLWEQVSDRKKGEHWWDNPFVLAVVFRTIGGLETP